MGNKRIRAVTSLAIAGIALLAVACKFVRNDNLNQAALAGDRVQCEVLMSRGANINGAGMHAMTPIMSAAKGGSLETVQYLVSSGADVNAHNDSGSALMWAIGSGNESIVRFLLMNGAKAGWTNALGRTALDFAREKKATNLVHVLETWEPKGEPNDPAHGHSPMNERTN